MKNVIKLNWLYIKNVELNVKTSKDADDSKSAATNVNDSLEDEEDDVHKKVPSTSYFLTYGRCH